MKELKLNVPDEKVQELGKDFVSLLKKHGIEAENKAFMKAILPVTERIKTFEDACKELGSGHSLVAEYNAFVAVNTMSPDIEAYIKLRIIAAALNEGWEPQFTNDEYRWYPWFTFWTEEELKEKSEKWKKDHVLWLFGGASISAATCGLAAAYSSDAWSPSNSYISARLAVKSEELAVYFGKQFISIWADYVGPFNRKEAEK